MILEATGKKATITSSRWSFNNSTDIEVSPANLEVVWGRWEQWMNLSVFLFRLMQERHSKPHLIIKMLKWALLLEIGLHPTDDQTAYALFSFARRPKVLRTTDLGQTWEDISGFDGINRESSRGFPDVATNCLLVFPNDTNKILGRQ